MTKEQVIVRVVITLLMIGTLAFLLGLMEVIFQSLRKYKRRRRVACLLQTTTRQPSRR